MKLPFIIACLIIPFFLLSCASDGNKTNVDKGTQSPAETLNQESQKEIDRDTANRLSPLRRSHGTIDGVRVQIQYGSPGVKDRKIWGSLVPYHRVWRAGANEATTMAFSRDVFINGEVLPEGRYGLFVIPRPDEEWMLIFNRIWDQWGAFNYDKREDVLRIPVPVKQTTRFYERLKYVVGDDTVNFYWEEKTFSIPIRAAGNS